MTELAPIADTCQPRADVLAGGLEGKHFAAQLDQVIRNPGDYASYADAESFFALTYPTEGLKELLAGTFARFTPPGAGTPANASAQANPRPPAAEHAVYRYETSFGGGKTHGLIALWHLAQGARPANVGEFIDPALLPDPEGCQVAAVSGLSLDPVNGLTTGAVTTYTLWGEITRQLGPEAWRRIQPSDEARTAPGKQTWLEAIGAAPTVIVIDELAYHIRQLGSSANHRVQAQGDATVASLQSLFEAATAAPAARIVVTLATGTDAYGRETDEVQQELFGAVSDRLAAETKDVMNRPKGAIGRPADDSEIGLILRRRLFDRVDEQAAAAAGQAYRELYASLDAAGAAAGAATSDPAAYGDLVAASYPFHPALIDCLDKRLGPLPGFQRARGALKFLAEAVRRIWSDGSDRPDGSEPGQRPAAGRAAGAARRIPIVNLGDMPLEDDQVRAQVTSEVARQEMNEPAKADFCGPASHAHQTDDANWPAERMATRACRAVFLHSIAAETVTPGASPAEVWTGVLRPGERPELADAALGKVLEDAWHLAYDGNRWRFNSAPNARKIISTELRNVLNTDVHEHLDTHIWTMFSGADWMKVVHAAAPSEVPDAASLRLVVMPYTDVRVRTATAAPPPEPVARIAETAGASETSRRFRNSVMFAVADETEIDTMSEKVRRELAAVRVVEDRDRFNQFQPDVRKGLKEERDRASLDRAVAIANTFRHLYWPASDRPNRHLRHVELPVRDHGRPDQMAAVRDLMESLGKLRADALPTDVLAHRSDFARTVGDKPAGEISTKALSEALWADPGLEILVNPTTLLIKSIVAGVQNGAWAYHDPAGGGTGGGGRTYTAASRRLPSPRIAPEAMLYSPDRARALGLLDPEPTVADVAAVLAAGSGLVEGPALRSGIETRLGIDTPPTKAKVCELVGVGSVGHDRLVAVEGRPAPGAKPLTRAQIEAAVLDRLTVMTHERAVAEGVVEAGGEAVRPVVETRPRKATVGAALQSAEAQMEDMGLTGREITRIAVTAYADGSAGTRNLRDLGRCADQLPRLTARFTGKLTAEFVDSKANSVEATFDCSRDDYDVFRDELMALADKGSDLTGHLQLGLTPNQPMTFGAADWNQLDRVLRNNAPDSVFIRVELAMEEQQDGGEGEGVDASQGRED